MNKVVAYLRVSTDRQEMEGTSLDTQQVACVQKAQELVGPGDEVVVLREIYSGLTLERPELTKLRESVRTGQVKGVITYSTDRLARDGLHLLLLVDEFEKAGAKVVFVTEPHEGTPEGQLLTYVRGWASKLEALKLKERTVRARKRRASDGRMPTGGNMYGYLYMKGQGESRGIRLPDTDKAPIVRSIFTWYVNEGFSLERIQKRLYALGILSPKGKPYWSTSQILRLLSNRAYTGETLTRWKVGGQAETIEVPGATPALVDRATFEAGQERRRLNKENARRRGKRDYLLRGMVYCECGRRMVGCAAKGKRNYRCAGHNWKPEIHCERSIRADKLEDAVWQKVKAILSEPETIKAQVEQLHGDKHSAAELKAQVATIDARLAALAQGELAIVRQMRLGLISEDVAAKELRQGQQDRGVLEREKAVLQGQIEAVDRWGNLDIEALCQAAAANLEAPTPEIIRLSLEALAVRVTVGTKEIKVSLALPVEPIPQDSFVLQPC